MQPLTIASYNIHKGVGADRRFDIRRITAVIQEIAPDLIALQEADARWGDRKGLLELEALNLHLNLVHEPVPGGGVSHGWHGNLLLVRDGQVTDVHHMALPGLEPRGAVITDLAVQRRRLRVISAHLGLLPSSRRQQVRAILDHLNGLPPLPTVLLGDLNEWRADPGSSLAHLDKALQPAPRVKSFPARFPVAALDRIFTGHGARLADVAVHDTPLARRASDHLPVKARLILPGGAA